MTKFRAIVTGIYAIFREIGREIVVWDYKRHVRRHTPNIPARRPEIHAAGLGGNSPDMWRGKDGR